MIARLRALTAIVWRADVVGWLLVVALLMAVGASSTGRTSWEHERQAAAVAELVDGAPPTSFELTLRSAGLEAVGAEGVGSVASRVDQFARDLDTPIREALTEPIVVIDTSRFAVVELGGSVPASPTFMTLRTQDGYGDRSEIVAGRRAASRPDGLVAEIELTAASADELGVRVGDRLLVEAALDDALGRQYRSLPAPFTVEVVGIVELTDAADPAWFGDERLHRPILVDTPLGADRLVTGAIAAEALRTAPFLVDGAAPFAIEWRARLDPAAIDRASVSSLRAAVRTLESETLENAVRDEIGVTTGAASLLGDVATRVDTVESIADRAGRWSYVSLVAATLALTAGAVGWVAASWRVVRRRGLGARLSGASAGLAAGGAGIVGGLAGAVVASVVFGSDTGVAAVGGELGVAVMCAAVCAAVIAAAAVRGRRIVDVGGVPVGRLDEPVGGWPIARRTLGSIIAVASFAAVIVTSGSGVDDWDLVVDVASFAAPAGLSLLVCRRVAPGRGAPAAAFAVGVVAAGSAWATFDPHADASDVVADAAQVARIITLVVVTMATAVAALALVRRRVDTVSTDAPESRPAPASGVAAVAVGIAVGSVWLAILHGVVLADATLPLIGDVGLPVIMLAGVVTVVPAALIAIVPWVRTAGGGDDAA